MDSALAQASELIPSMLPVPLSQSLRPGRPPPSPTRSQLLPRPTTPPSRLPARSPSLVLPPSVETGLKDDSAEVSRALTNWHAARESVLSQMVTSRDIVTPAIVSQAKAKTGGRRGRGGRRSTNKIQGHLHSGVEDHAFTPVGATGHPSGRGRGRGRGRGGGRPRGSASGLKRKRDESEDETRVVKNESDSSETFTPLPTQSRSGRRIFQASAFTPVVLGLEAGTEFRSLPANGTAAPVERGKRGRRGHGKAGDASVCKNCGRGHSPASNMIVFCDGCNTPWHQYCHDKPISNDVVLIEEKEWFCADCDVLQEERVQLKETVSAEGMSLAEVTIVFSLPASRNLFYGLHNNISWQLALETTVLANSSRLPPCVSASPRHQSLPDSAYPLCQHAIRGQHHYARPIPKLYRPTGCRGGGRNLRSIP